MSKEKTGQRKHNGQNLKLAFNSKMTAKSNFPTKTRKKVLNRSSVTLHTSL